MRESTASTPMFASYLQTVEEVTAVLAGCSYCKTWSPRLYGRNKARFSPDSDGYYEPVAGEGGGEKLSSDVRNYTRAFGVRSQQILTYKIFLKYSVQIWNNGFKCYTNS